MSNYLLVFAVVGGNVAVAGVTQDPSPVPPKPAVVDTRGILGEEQIPPPLDDEQAAELKKARIPVPSTQDRAGYLAWKKKLPKATRARLDRYCRYWDTEYRVACNGIGLLAIPIPPMLVKMPRHEGRVVMTHDQWKADLTPAQRRFFIKTCEVVPPDGGEGAAYSELCGGTPLVLAFDDVRVQYAPSSTGPSDWPTTATPWLALDRDGDGAITTAAELFGSSTLIDGGRAATHGFEALAELDANRDGVIDAQDPAFASLLVWADRDGDRQSSPGELTPLASSVVSLSLGYRREGHCDERMNCEGERSAMQWRDATGALRSGSVIDVYLHYR